MVYFIENSDSNAVKIGESNNPVRRKQELQTGSPAKLSILLVFPGGELKERELHNRFKKYKIDGTNEWFRFEGELREFVNKERDGKTTSCKICGGLFSASDTYDSDIVEHCKTHEAILKAGFPYHLREVTKKIGHSILQGDDELNLSIGNIHRPNLVGKHLVVYGWWARARANGLPDKKSEDYILDQMNYIEAQLSKNTEDIRKITRVIDERWGVYG